MDTFTLYPWFNSLWGKRLFPDSTTKKQPREELWVAQPGGQVAGEEKVGTITRRRQVGVKGPGPLEMLLPSFVPITPVDHMAFSPHNIP